MNNAYKRLMKINKAHRLNTNVNKVRLDVNKDNCILEEIIANQKEAISYITSLNDLYDILRGNNYIENLSAIRNQNNILNTIILDKFMWNSIKISLAQINKKKGIINSFSVEKVNDIDDIIGKSVLLGNLILKTKLFVLICTNKLDVKLFIENDLKILDTTDFQFTGIDIKHIKLQHLKLDNLTTLSCLFFACYKTESIYLDIDTKGVENFTAMFCGCKNLKQINIETIQTDRAITLSNMFCDCTSIKELNLNHFKVENVKSFNSMFSGCKNLVTLNIDTWNITNKDYLEFDNMFEKCNKLKKCNEFVFKKYLKSINSKNIIFD